MNRNGGKAKKAVHAHEKKMHPGKPLTKMPFKNGDKDKDDRKINRKK
jgi:hypothetical protein